ncbi:MAG: hypothetical protein IJX87_02375 [Clostridia bacterium]|nr:hypothetical protein [Clostridia bacterium]
MKTCSFFGHRNIRGSPELCETIRQTVVRLMQENGVKIFLFGSASRFDELCLKIVTEIKAEYPEIQRVYVRSQYPYLEKDYKEYLLESYDDTYMPNRIENAGKASYVERNQEMIDASDFCVFYCDEAYKPPLRKQSRRSLTSYQPKSGTALAYQYAKQKKKEIINLYK